MGDLVDLNKFRAEKAEEDKRKAEAEALKAAEEAEAAQQAEIDYMKAFLDSLISSLGSAMSLSGSSLNNVNMGYYPMTDDDYYNYVSESGYNEDGYYEAHWDLHHDFEEDDDV